MCEQVRVDGITKSTRCLVVVLFCSSDVSQEGREALQQAVVMQLMTEMGGAHKDTIPLLLAQYECVYMYQGGGGGGGEAGRIISALNPRKSTTLPILHKWLNGIAAFF